jgi:hypothetical protein
VALLRRSLLATLLLATAAVCADGPPSAVAPPTEYEVKAAFLYNFARFVEWPPDALGSPGDPFVVAVLGRDPFGPVLDETLAGKTIAGRRVEVRRTDRVADALEAEIVFVCASERANVPAILKALDKPGLLTVGDSEGFAEQGGAINFVVQARKVRFEINPARAERAGLKMSSQLLKLATLVAGPRS